MARPAPRWNRVSSLAAAGSVVAVAATTAVPAMASAAVPIADYQMPFTCGQLWTGETRPSHSPSTLAIDWNRDGDLGKRVLAPAPAIVSRVENLGSRSYGLYVVLDHGNSESTLFAHLAAEYVTAGERVDAGEVIGAVGSSGGSSGPHLHYEQRKDGHDVQPYFDGVPFKFPSKIASKNCPDWPVVGDWNNDGKADLGTFSRWAYGWLNQLVAGQVTKVRRGTGADQPLVGDWDGDGRTDLGLRRATAAEFVLRPASGAAPVRLTLGALEDKPVAGDWNGDGSTDIGLWRPTTATFWLRRPDGSVSKVQLGTPSQLPVTGDWNGDGVTDLGVFDPATAEWSLRMTAKDGTVWTASTRLGSAGDLPVTGDWDGDGAADLGVWTPSTASWTLRTAATATNGPARLVKKTFGAAR